MAHAVAVAGASTRIIDDFEAINRGRLAGCHELRVIHNVRIRGRPVVSTLTAGGSEYSQQLPSNVSTSRNVPGVNFSRDMDSSEDITSLNPSSEFRNASRAHSRHGNTNATHAEHTQDYRECSGIWCWIRDLILLYSAVGVSYLLFQTPNTQSTSGMEPAYDMIP